MRHLSLSYQNKIIEPFPRDSHKTASAPRASKWVLTAWKHLDLRLSPAGLFGSSMVPHRRDISFSTISPLQEVLLLLFFIVNGKPCERCITDPCWSWMHIIIPDKFLVQIASLHLYTAPTPPFLNLVLILFHSIYVYIFFLLYGFL